MQKAVVSLIDDLDGSVADVTVTFGYQGQEYEIDLNQEHANEMRETLGSYAVHARTVRAHRQQHAGRGPRRTAASRQRSAQMRAWATEHGFAIKERGRVPVEVVEAYEEAVRGGPAADGHPGQATAEAPARRRRASSARRPR
jgi:hypothetical protein